MPRYRISIEFDASGNLPEKALSNIAEDMRVQLESLEDGTYEDICGEGVRYNITNQKTDSREI